MSLWLLYLTTTSQVVFATFIPKSVVLFFHIFIEALKNGTGTACIQHLRLYLLVLKILNVFLISLLFSMQLHPPAAGRAAPWPGTRGEPRSPRIAGPFALLSPQLLHRPPPHRRDLEHPFQPVPADAAHPLGAAPAHGGKVSRLRHRISTHLRR